jgi:predicted lipid-binding transport protein (Tim44 family)
MGGSALGSAITKARLKRKLGKVEDAAKAANADDGYWDPAMLKQRVREAFFPIQNSWEKRSVEESRPFCSDSLFERHKLQLDGFEKQNRVNRIQDLNLQSVELVRIHNVTDDGEDRFVARIKCSARDWMEDTKTGQMINGSKSVSQFEQFWSFSRHPQYGWVLDEIQQGTEGQYHLGKIVNDDQGEPTYGEQQPPQQQPPQQQPPQQPAVPS